MPTDSGRPSSDEHIVHITKQQITVTDRPVTRVSERVSEIRRSLAISAREAIEQPIEVSIESSFNPLLNIQSYRRNGRQED